jgi:hypothetical protein
MNNEKNPILSKEERKKLIENTSIIHQVIEEVSAKRKRGKLEFLRHPVFILIIGAGLSYFLVPLFQKHQANVAENVKAKYELLKEVSLYKGKVIAMAENVVYLHQKPITKREQIINTNKSFNAAYGEFSSNFIRIKYELKIIFKNENINKELIYIQKELKELNDLLDLLHEIPTSEISEEHAERMDICKKKIQKIKEKLDSLFDLMIKALH